MKKATIFEVAIKLLGIYMIQHVFYPILEIIKFLLVYKTGNLDSNSIQLGASSMDYLGLILYPSILHFIFYGLFTYFLLFRTKSIIRIFQKRMMMKQ